MQQTIIQIKQSDIIDLKQFNSQLRTRMMNNGELFSVLRLSKNDEFSVRTAFRTEQQEVNLTNYESTSIGKAECKYRSTMKEFYKEETVSIKSIPSMIFKSDIQIPSELKYSNIIKLLVNSLNTDEVIELNLFDKTISSTIKTNEELTEIISKL